MWPKADVRFDDCGSVPFDGRKPRDGKGKPSIKDDRIRSSDRFLKFDRKTAVYWFDTLVDGHAIPTHARRMIASLHAIVCSLMWRFDHYADYDFQDEEDRECCLDSVRKAWPKLFYNNLIYEFSQDLLLVENSRSDVNDLRSPSYDCGASH